MKLPNAPLVRAHRDAPCSQRLAHFLIPAVACLLAIPAKAANPAPAGGTPVKMDADKPYTLFMGANVSVEWQGKLRPLRDVEKGAFVIDADGSRATVPSQARNLKIKIDESLKVAPSGVVVSGFKPERAYTLDNDPNRNFAEAGRNAMDAAAVADLQVVASNDAATKLGIVSAESGREDLGGPPASVREEAKSAVEQTTAALQSSAVAQGAAINSVGDAGSRAAIDGTQERFDALRLNFEISSRTPLANPYMVVVMRFRTDAQKPSGAQQWVYAQELGPVGPKPRMVRLFRSGFPPGYTIDDVQLHLYDRGTELASNVARKSIGISEDEAYQFSVVSYVEQHRAANLEPVAAEIASPAHLRSKVSADKIGRTYYLKVAKNGQPIGAFSDQACSQKIADSDLAAALATLRFYPALKNGKPVEAVAPVKW